MSRCAEQCPALKRVGITLTAAVVVAASAGIALAGSGGGQRVVPPEALFRAEAPATTPWGAPTVPVGGNPVGVGVDQATDTIYVANQTDNTVSVINGATCNARHTSGCSQISPRVTIGNFAIALVVDQATDTIYVVNAGDNTVSVINGARCNANDASGCHQAPATVRVGNFPTGLAIDEETHTVYVGNSGDSTVSVINAAICNGTVTSGCGRTPPKVTAGPGVNGLAVDQATDTLYVANQFGGTVSVINGATCNATVTSGCGQIPKTISVGVNPTQLAVDESTDTIYVPFGPMGDATTNLGSVAVINGATCNSTVASGCDQIPHLVGVGSSPIFATLNPATRTVYVVNEEDSSVSAIDAATCNATVSSGCSKTPPAMAVGFNPAMLDVDLATNTVYVSSQNTNTVSVLNGATCNASRASGCTRFAPTTAIGTAPQEIAVNESTNTIYVGNNTDNTVSVIDGAGCNATHGSSCRRAWPTIAVGASPFGLAVDGATDTIYVANSADNTVSVINGATCNAHRSSGCGQTPPTVTVGAAPFGLAVDETTHTVYVANIDDNTVSVIDGSTCNAHVTSGCGQTPSTVGVGHGPIWLALDHPTRTVYVANIGDNTVSVINGATCNARASSGCGQIPPTVTVGNAPIGMDIDHATDTIYVANRGDSTVSVIDGSTCNARISSGCAQTPPTVTVGGFPFGVAVDQTSNIIYVTSIIDADVAVINGASCRASHTRDCHQKLVPVRMGGWPVAVAVDKAAGSFYVSDNVDGTVSFFPLLGD